jgi:hypothetical protein
VVDVESDVLDVVAALDGDTPLRDVIEEAADRLGLPANERAQLERDAVEAARELLELGALVIG